MKELREDQAAAIDALRASLASGNRRVLMMGPTGYGKTMVAASIIRSARDRDKRVLMTVPAISLVDQTVEALYEQGIEDVGVLQANHRGTDASKPVQVASVQTLMRREIPKCDLKLVDEAHVRFKLYDKLLLSEEQRSIPTIGLSATPWSKGLGLYYQDLIIAATTADLITKGFLAPFRVFAPSHPDLTGVRTQLGDYHEGDLGVAMDKPKLVADIIQTWQERGEGRPTICFAVNRAHARNIADRFEEAGVSAAYMDCNTPLSERQEIQQRFEAFDISVVCNVDVLGMGIDWPCISCVIYARPTKSEMKYVQHVGRALRIAPGKSDCIILDHSDTTLRLGFVTDIIHDELCDGKPKDSTPREAPLPKACPACSYLKPPRTAVCPNCGHEAKHHAAPIVSQPGVLQELTPQPKGSAAKFPDRRATFGMLAWYGASKGYSPGWSANKFRDLYGIWPRGMNDVLQHRCVPSPELMTWIRHTQIAWAKSKRRPVSPVERKARDDAIIAGVREKFLPGTLLTAQDVEEFR